MEANINILQVCSFGRLQNISRTASCFTIILIVLLENALSIYSTKIIMNFER